MTLLIALLLLKIAGLSTVWSGVGVFILWVLHLAYHTD